MIVLSQTTDKIQIVLAGTVATNQAQCVACWRDITSTPTYVAGRSVANTNNTTDVDLIAAPASSTQRVIDFLSVFNNDTASITVTIKFDANGTDYIVWKGTLATGERLEYENGKGWTINNISGGVVSVGNPGSDGADGSDGALTVNEIEVDFGAISTWDKQFTISVPGLTSANKAIVVQSGNAPTDKQSDDNAMDWLALNARCGTDQLIINARAVTGPVHGKFKLNYQFS